VKAKLRRQRGTYLRTGRERRKESTMSTEKDAQHCDRQADSCRDSEHDDERAYEKPWRDRAAAIRAQAGMPIPRARLKDLAREAGLDVSLWEMGSGSLVTSPGVDGICLDELFNFARLVAQETRND